MYYYPFWLHLFNYFSFKHHNSIDETTVPQQSIELLSIKRGFLKNCHTITASYNCFTQNYHFYGNRYVSYEDVVRKALTL
jgi:hypothetical protein